MVPCKGGWVGSFIGGQHCVDLHQRPVTMVNATFYRGRGFRSNRVSMYMAVCTVKPQTMFTVKP